MTRRIDTTQVKISAGPFVTLAANGQVGVTLSAGSGIVVAANGQIRTSVAASTGVSETVNPLLLSLL
jgi:hypothetical protein